jgi:hypothetical protein
MDLDFTRVEDYGEFMIVWRVPFISGKVDLPESFKLRIRCHRLLAQLPERGLQEAWDSLVGMWQFYHGRAVRAPNTLQSPPEPARVTASYTRPPFKLPEE